MMKNNFQMKKKSTKKSKNIIEEKSPKNRKLINFFFKHVTVITIFEYCTVGENNFPFRFD